MTFTHAHVVRAAVLSKDETKLFTGGQEKKLRIFDLERPNGLLDFLCFFPSVFLFSPFFLLLIVPEPTILEGHTGIVKTLLLEEERENLFFSAGDEKEIRYSTPASSPPRQEISFRFDF